MAKRTKPPQFDMTDCCRRCAYNEGEGVMKFMFHCSFLDYCHNSYLGCEAERLGKGKFKEKTL